MFRFIAAVGCLIYDASNLATLPVALSGVSVTKLRRFSYSGSEALARLLAMYL